MTDQRKIQSGKIFLFPVPLSEGNLDAVLPARNIELIKNIKVFVVENIRSARRFLKKCDRSIDIDTLTFFTLNEHTAPEEVPQMIVPALEGNDIGVISEAGCPAVADPGADIVALAQRKGIEVVPLVGPSSILWDLWARGSTVRHLLLRDTCLLTRHREPPALKRWSAG